MDLKRKLFPIAVALVLIALLFVSWVPNWENNTFLRSTKPYVSVTYERDDVAVLNQVAEDLENRLEVRHEWHKVAADEAQYQITINIRQQDSVIALTAHIRQQQKSLDQIVVRGESAVKHELTGRLVTLLTDRIQANHLPN